MEPVTQALLGAATAHCVAGKALGRRALGWGAILGMSPDLDVLLGPLHGGYGEWLYHRGTTHSLWFGFVVGPLLGMLLWRWRDPERETPRSAWIALAIVALVTHPLLDGFTPYGTQFLAPFARDRFAWNGVAIVDPFYSVLLAAGVVAVALRRFGDRVGRRLLYASLGLSTAYLLAGLAVNQWVVEDIRRALTEIGQPLGRIRAYPTIFQPWLRSFVARSDEQILVGLHSWTDPGCPSWRIHPRGGTSPESRLALESWEGRLLTWFADGDIGVFEEPGPRGVGIRIEDLRYSWSNAGGRGMWGLETFVRDGELGPIRRFDRPPLDPNDLGRFRRLLRGQLPGPASGWSRPTRCLPAAG